LDRFAFLTAPWFWAFLAGAIFLSYGLSGRLAYINILGIVKQYKKIFSKTMDFLFFMVFPLFLSTASTIHSIISEDLANIMAVILAILTSMVLAFMVMTNSKYENSIGKADRNLGDFQLKHRNQDALAVGAYEIFISILVLILLFTLPIACGSEAAQRILSFVIFYGFYSFLLNVFIMVRRLFQIFFDK